jgi:hypothetical protein
MLSSLRGSRSPDASSQLREAILEIMDPVIMSCILFPFLVEMGGRVRYYDGLRQSHWGICSSCARRG